MKEIIKREFPSFELEDNLAALTEGGVDKVRRCYSRKKLKENKAVAEINQLRGLTVLKNNIEVDDTSRLYWCRDNSKSRDNLIAKLPLTLVSLENKVNAGR